MPDSVAEPFSLLASLQAGPPGKIRVRYDFPYLSLLRQLLRGFRFGGTSRSQTTPMVEIDRAKLRRLQFSQKELAEIGFSLVTQLCILERCRSEVENDA